MSAPILLLVGFIVGIGFLGNALFERTKFSDAPFLVAVGLALGPGFHLIDPSGLLPFLPAFGSIALALILFEGGLGLELGSAASDAGRSTVLAFFSFALSLLLIRNALALAFDLTDHRSWLIAAALSSAGASVVGPIAKTLGIGPAVSVFSVESAASEALSVLVVLSALDGNLTFSGIGFSFLLGAAVAAATGLLWLFILSRFARHSFFYLMTIGAAFLLMGGLELVHGSGAFAVVVFGMILANGDPLVVRFSPSPRSAAADAETRPSIHARITESLAGINLLIRGFFFVSLGVFFRWPGADMRMWLAIALVMIAIVASRSAAVQLSGWVCGFSASKRVFLNALLPRGLAAAILTLIVASRYPEEGPSWVTLSVCIVLLSNLWMSVRLVGMKERKSEAADVV